MARPRLESGAGQTPSVVKRRPTDLVDIIGNSTGGIAVARAGRTGRPQDVMMLKLDRNPSIANDTRITRTRIPIFRRGYYIPPAQAWMNWTESGPTRDIITFRFSRNIRPIVGGSNQDLYGMHTNPERTITDPLKGKPRMRPGRQNRLTVQKYRGQSFSQTTNLAGQ